MFGSLLGSIGKAAMSVGKASIKGGSIIGRKIGGAIKGKKAPKLSPDGPATQGAPDPTSVKPEQVSPLRQGMANAMAGLGEDLQNQEGTMPYDPNLGQGFAPVAAGSGMQMPQLGGMMPYRSALSRMAPQLPFGGFRAMGGPVVPGKRYRVGENGPEEIVLDQPGVVIPTDDLPGESSGRRAPSLSDTPGISASPPTPSYGVNDDITGDVSMPEGVAPPPRVKPFDPLDYRISQAQKAKQGVIDSGEQHVPKWQSALYYMFQGMQKFANPRDNTPVRPLGQVRQEGRIAQADQKLQPLLQQREQNMAMKAAQLKGMRDANPHLYQTIMADGAVTEEEAAIAAQQGLGMLMPGDYRKFDTKMINGEEWATPNIGAPNNQRTNLPTDPTKHETALEVETAGGVPVKTTGNKQLDREAQVQAANARMIVETTKRNADAIDDNRQIRETNKVHTSNLQKEKRLKFENARDLNQSAANDAAAAQRIGQEIEGMGDSILADPAEKSKKQKEYNDLMKSAEEKMLKAKQLENEANNMKDPEVKTPKGTIKAPQLSAPKVKMSKIDQIIRQ